MWLLPAVPLLAGAATRLYYRFEVDGPAAPRTGPLLLLANHPNALLDPALVAAAAGRPVRFLAKSTLFGDRLVGRLVRAAGAIPVYRRMDDPEQTGRNVEAFEEVFGALAGGDAVGMFPEGLSHSEPSLARLRTGAARIALGYAARRRRTFPIVPVGLVFRDKERFRSEALALLGGPVDWADLAGRGVEDRDAVLAMTSRIDTALRQVTINLERREDARLVDAVEAIWNAEVSPATDAAGRVARVDRIVERLAALRRDEPERAAALSRQVRAHRRRLEWLGVTAADVASAERLAAGLRRRALRILPLVPLAGSLAAVGWALFWPPYRLTGWLADGLRPAAEMRSTYRVLIGAGLYGVWIAALAGLAALRLGAAGALAAAVGVPAIGIAGLHVRERWRRASGDLERFLRARSRHARVRALSEQQHELIAELRAEAEHAG